MSFCISQQWRIQNFPDRGVNPGRGALTYYLPPANEVWGKVIFSQACVKNSVHRGVPGPGGGLLPGWGSAPRGVAWSRRGCLFPGGAGWWRPPPGHLLLRAVHILLECILVWHNFCRKLHENEKNWNESGRAYITPLHPSILLLTYWFGGESCIFTVLRGLEFTEGVARGVFKFSKDCKNTGFID